MRQRAPTGNGDGHELAYRGDDAGCDSHSFSTPELEAMLRCFRLRRRLGLLPEAEPLPAGDVDLQRLRQMWRPHLHAARLRARGEGGAGADGARDAQGADPLDDVAAEVSHLQQRVEQGYRKLNADRRDQSALEEGLRRQGDSLAAITAESARLQAELSRVQREVREHTSTNRDLSVRLGIERENRAKSVTQAALLSTALGKLMDTQLGSTTPVVPAATDVATELIACRAQISQLVAENDALRRIRGSGA